MGALGLAPPGASAQESSALVEADAAWEEGDFDAAERAYRRARRTPLGVASWAHIELRLGMLALLDGDERRAFDAFERALAVDPLLEPPTELPPELATRFVEARERRDGRRMRLALSVEVVEEARELQVALFDPPPRMEATLVVRVDDRELARLPYDEPEWRYTTRESGVLSVALEDAHGQQLARAGRRAARAPGEGVMASGALESILDESEPNNGHTPILESPWLWVAVSTALLAIGALIIAGASGSRTVLGPPTIR